MIVPALTVIALLLALALNRAGRGAAVFRGVFFSSAVLSVTIVTLIWRFMLAPDAGLARRSLEGARVRRRCRSSATRISCFRRSRITTIWWSVGFPMLLFLAGLQQIPSDMYEAAALDNASRWTTFWRITLPSLRRTVVLVVMLQTAAQLQLFGQSQLLTAGGPSGASRTAVLFLFETRVRPVGAGLCQRRRRNAVPDHPRGHAHPILGDRRGRGGAGWPLTCSRGRLTPLGWAALTHRRR